MQKSYNKNFYKNIVLYREDEKRFQSSNKCCIFDKLFTNEDKKVRDNDHITRKYKGPAQLDCNINLKLTKKVLVIFHNLRGYDGHLIKQEISKSDIKLSVIHKWIRNIYGFTINKNLIFIDSI